ncbi:hypothetical protein CCR85_06150 [Rhodothalassium salexigens]|uniref:ATP-grasp domain-containing protein n=1 Tax=Rhodothalassium salexigens TaxID=1086 RepID=UPI001913552A|nr:ATP-grasp domain-containing protein [Rhodothalassium salexigens]MBK5911072.1 hypothetical protein [Rhodothalassium salexigens]
MTDPRAVPACARWPRAQNMPPLDADAEKIAPFELWPMRLFYSPVPVMMAWLSLRYGGITLPTAANPGLRYGGFVGESKLEALALFQEPARQWLAPYTGFHVPDDGQPADAVLAQCEAAMAAAGLAYPVVAKPDMGCRGIGVQVVRDAADLARYLGEFPAGRDLVLQTLIDWEGEAGIYYVRDPDAERGEIFSMTLKYFPYVIGDGVSTLRALITAEERAGRLCHIYLPRHRDRLDHVLAEGEPYRLAFAGSHSRGAIYRNGTPYVTEALRRRIDQIARAMPGFHAGRFDVRFDDFAQLRAGERFKILEVNGTGSEAIEIWDARTGLGQAYRTLYRQWRHLYRIGAKNRARGHKPDGIRAIWRGSREELALWKVYPETH